MTSNHTRIGAIVRACLGAACASAVLAGLLVPSAARAWGDDGHRVVALIAYRHLTPAVRAKVDAILQADADALTAPDIASRATWADAYRDSDRATTRERYLLTREWHFVDIELDHPDLAAACFGHPPPATPASAGPAKACVVDRINAFAQELKQLPQSDPERTVAFRFLLHLVGDLHQPLHAADHGDQGGNKVMVSSGTSPRTETLHSFWDQRTVAALGKNPAAIAAVLDKRYGAQCPGWMLGSVADWAMETFAVASNVAYRTGHEMQAGGTETPVPLSPAYQQRAAATASRQLEKAGCRLAAVLNRALQ